MTTRALTRTGALIVLLATRGGCAPPPKVHLALRIVPEQPPPPTAERLIVPFGHGADGTQLLLSLFSQAFERGADRITDVAFHFEVESGGQRLRCQRRVVKRRDRAPLAGGVDQIAPLHRITRFVRERALGADTESTQQVQKAKLDCKKTMDGRPICPPLLGSPHTRRLPHWRYYVAERYVSRYAFEFDAGFVSPDWRLLAGMFSDDLLALAPATCRKAKPGDPGGNSVTARVARLRKQGVEQPASMKAAEQWRLR